MHVGGGYTGCCKGYRSCVRRGHPAVTGVSGVRLPGLTDEIGGRETIYFPEAFGEIGRAAKAGFVCGIGAVESLPEEFDGL